MRRKLSARRSARHEAPKAPPQGPALTLTEDRFVFRQTSEEGPVRAWIARSLPYVVESLLSDATELGRALSPPSPSQSAEGLARLAREDADHGVRLRCLEVLTSAFPDLPLTRTTCREALGDRSPRVRLQAAVGLGKDGTEPLKERVEGDSCPDSVAEEGFKHISCRSRRAKPFGLSWPPSSVGGRPCAGSPPGPSAG